MNVRTFFGLLRAELRATTNDFLLERAALAGEYPSTPTPLAGVEGRARPGVKSSEEPPFARQDVPTYPLGAAIPPNAAAAEGDAHPGGEIRGPQAASHPRSGAPRSERSSAKRVAALRSLAEQQIAECTEPGWPWGGSGDWSGCIAGMLGGTTGEYCAALHPSKLLAVLDALEAIGGNPCSNGDAVFDCLDVIGPDRAKWCSYCRAHEALRILTSSNPVSVTPGDEDSSGGSSHDDVADPPDVTKNVPS